MKRVFWGATSGVALGLALAVRSTVRAPAFDEAPWLLTSLPSAPLLLAATLGIGVLGALLGARGKERLATPFLASGLAAAIFLPGVFELAPFLASISGRLLDLVLLVALLVSLGRLLNSSSGPSFPLSPAAVFGIGFFLYVSVGLELHRTVGLSGDEPHYLLIAESLLRDGDIAVQNNYRDGDYRRFYQGKIGPHLAQGTPYSIHGVGVPLLLLPGFALGGLVGVVLMEALLSALLVSAIYSMALELTASRKAALFSAAGFGLTAPALFLSVSAYPELPAALVTLLVARRLLDPVAPRPISAATLAVLAGLLPFFHVKFAPLGAVLLLSLFLRYRRKPGSALALAAGAALSVAAVLLFSLFTTGSVDPTASYGRQRIFFDRIPIGVVGLFLDQEFGLLPSSPVYLLGLAGVASLYRRERLSGWLAVLVLLSVLLPGAAHPLWSGGNSPPARFLFPALPLLMVSAACLVARERELPLVRWAPSLLAISLALGAAMLLLSGQPLYLNARDGTGRIWEALSSSWDLTAYLPSIVAWDGRSRVVAAALAALVVMLVTAHLARWRLALPPFAAVVLLGAFLQDLARVSPSRAFEARWASEVMLELPRHSRDRFLSLPSRERLRSSELARRISLPLEAASGDGDPGSWWSREYRLPAGRFRLSGVVPEGLTLCNGDGCFASGSLEFSSEVSLARFRIRARALSEAPRLRLLEPRVSRFDAQRTVSLAPGARLHGLDEDVYLDPAGMWIRKGSSASFALEAEGAARLRLANGGVENGVTIEEPRGTRSFVLRPWEELEVSVEVEGPVVPLRIESETGFRPEDLDPSSEDRRELGVLIRIGPRAFDSVPPVPDNESIE